MWRDFLFSAVKQPSSSYSLLSPEILSARLRYFVLCRGNYTQGLLCFCELPPGEVSKFLVWLQARPDNGAGIPSSGKSLFLIPRGHSRSTSNRLPSARVGRSYARFNRIIIHSFLKLNSCSGKVNLVIPKDHTQGIGC
jgi:hypothetical protein